MNKLLSIPPGPIRENLGKLIQSPFQSCGGNSRLEITMIGWRIVHPEYVRIVMKALGKPLSAEEEPYAEVFSISFAEPVIYDRGWDARELNESTFDGGISEAHINPTGIHLASQVRVAWARPAAVTCNEATASVDEFYQCNADTMNVRMMELSFDHRRVPQKAMIPANNWLIGMTILSIFALCASTVQLHTNARILSYVSDINYFSWSDLLKNPKKKPVLKARLVLAFSIGFCLVFTTAGLWVAIRAPITVAQNPDEQYSLLALIAPIVGAVLILPLGWTPWLAYRRSKKSKRLAKLEPVAFLVSPPLSTIALNMALSVAQVIAAGAAYSYTIPELMLFAVAQEGKLCDYDGCGGLFRRYASLTELSLFLLSVPALRFLQWAPGRRETQVVFLLVIFIVAVFAMVSSATLGSHKNADIFSDFSADQATAVTTIAPATLLVGLFLPKLFHRRPLDDEQRQHLYEMLHTEVILSERKHKVYRKSKKWANTLAKDVFAPLALLSGVCGALWVFVSPTQLTDLPPGLEPQLEPRSNMLRGVAAGGQGFF